MNPNITTTGNIRYRTQTRMFRKDVLVLQVEERVVGYHYDMYGSGPDFDYRRWRDAKPEDLQPAIATHGEEA